MINQIFATIMNIFLMLCSILATIITYPLYALISPFFPNLDSYFVNSSYYFTNLLYTSISFSKEVFFNLTGFPRPLFYLLVSLFLARITFHLTFILIRFLITVYNFVRGHLPSADITRPSGGSGPIVGA